MVMCKGQESQDAMWMELMCKGQESQDAMWMEQWSCVRDKNHKMPCGWSNGHVETTGYLVSSVSSVNNKHS